MHHRAPASMHSPAATGANDWSLPHSAAARWQPAARDMCTQCHMRDAPGGHREEYSHKRAPAPSPPGMEAAPPPAAAMHAAATAQPAMATPAATARAARGPVRIGRVRIFPAASPHWSAASATVARNAMQPKMRAAAGKARALHGPWDLLVSRGVSVALGHTSTHAAQCQSTDALPVHSCGDRSQLITIGATLRPA